MRNPFKPTAGATPPLLLGRDDDLDLYREAVQDGPGAPHLLTLVTGARGVGKTVMLTELGNIARSEGWIVIDETATPGFMDRIADQADRARAELGSPDRGRLTGVGIAPLGHLTREAPDLPDPSWRDRVGELLDTLVPHETGVTITLDEVHAADADELRHLAAAVQHLIREARSVSLVMAGLPKATEDILLKGDRSVSTFLRRAERIRLGDVPITEVTDSLRETFAATGRTIDDGDIARAGEASGGYPFMIQLVGHQIWRRADDDGVIDGEATRDGIAAARDRLGALVHGPALADLSPMDRRVLAAMAQDDGASQVADIAERIARDRGYVGVYRDRLLAAGVVRSPERGLLDFALPYLREYLRERGSGAARH